MNRSRVLILLGILLLVGAVAILVILPQLLVPQTPPTPTATPAPEIPITEIIVAAQNIPRGAVIGADAIIPSKWPNNSLPPTELIVTDPAQVIGKIARTDILRGQPVLSDEMTQSPKDLVARGNDAALFIPAGKVAVAFPISKLTSVGYAIGAGDHVDVIVSFSVEDANTEGQYPVVPFNRDLVDELVSAGMDAKTAIATALSDQAKAQVQPRLLSQLTLQDVEVLHTGEWPAGGLLPNPTPTLSSEQAAPAPVPTSGTPTATPPRPDIVLLLVDHQQALVLQWLQASGVSVNLALRAAGDNAPASTDTVSYQYILTNFNITIPPKTNTIIVKPPSAATPPQ